MINKILIPTDFSPAAWQAVQFGLSLAEKVGAEITLLHVYPSENKYMSWLKTSSTGDASIINDLNLKMKEFTEDLNHGLNSEIYYHVTSGNVTKEIINYVKDNSYDLVIIGANSGSAHNDPGSNTGEIIRNAGFPVLVIPGVYKKVVAA